MSALKNIAGAVSRFLLAWNFLLWGPAAVSFFASATAAAPSLAQERGFIFGGQPVPASSQLVTTAPGSAQLYAFSLQPDTALQSPVPFITQSTGGNIPNPSVSPYYVVAPAQSPFGAFNPNTTAFGG